MQRVGRGQRLAEKHDTDGERLSSGHSPRQGSMRSRRQERDSDLAVGEDGAVPRGGRGVVGRHIGGPRLHDAEERGDGARPSARSRRPGRPARRPGDEKSGDPVGLFVELAVGEAPPGRVDDGGPIGKARGAGLEIVDEAAAVRRVHARAQRCACFRSTNAAMSCMRSKLSTSVSWASISILDSSSRKLISASVPSESRMPARAQRRVVPQVVWRSRPAGIGSE